MSYSNNMTMTGVNHLVALFTVEVYVPANTWGAMSDADLEVVAEAATDTIDAPDMFREMIASLVRKNIVNASKGAKNIDIARSVGVRVKT